MDEKILDEIENIINIHPSWSTQQALINKIMYYLKEKRIALQMLRK